MKCGYCGWENRDGAKFCSSCGQKLLGPSQVQPLEDDYLEDTRTYQQRDFIPVYEPEINPEEAKKKKMVKIVGLVVGLVVLVLVGSFAYKGIRKSNLEKKAEKLLETEDYQEATKEYTKLYKMTGDEDYKEEMMKAQTLARDSEGLKDAQSFLAQEAYKGALEKYLEVKNHNNDLAEEAREGMIDLQEKVGAKVDSYNMASRYGASLKLLEGLLAVDPDNEKFQALKEEALLGQNAENAEKAKVEQEKQEEAARQKKAAQEAENAVKRQQAARAAYNIVNTYQYVTANQANVRQGPGKNYGVAYVLTQGTEVYVQDTSFDGTRIWCNIGDGWISYRTLNGTY